MAPPLSPGARSASSLLYDSDQERDKTSRKKKSKSRRGGGREATSGFDIDLAREGLNDSEFDDDKANKRNPVIVPKVDEEALLVQKTFFQFLQAKKDDEFIPAIDYMKERNKVTLRVDFKDITEHNQDLAEAIRDDYYRFAPFLDRALDKFVAEVDPDFAAGDNSFRTRKFHVSVANLDSVERVRDLNTSRIGKLSSITGTVTRTSEVRPELYRGTFRCKVCGHLMQDVEQHFKITFPVMCISRSKECMTNKQRGFELVPELSMFVDWQKVRVQENATEVPAGSMPRSIEVIVRHDSVEKAKPGDQCVFTGSLMVIPDVTKLRTPRGAPELKFEARGNNKAGLEQNADGITGWSELGVRDLTYKMAFLACDVAPVAAGLRMQQMDDEFLDDFTMGGGHTGSTRTQQQDMDAAKRLQMLVASTYTTEEFQEIADMAKLPGLVDCMRRSVAPSIYGHADVKLGILLMLFGGVHKRTKDGINLRGDINVCVVGDPSTAKSQFLKWVCSFAPRAVYTSGKASTAAGLTASVVRDVESGEFCIEAGALMLADNGVCCIDEFDKMDDVDQVAIHEAMEQQTISITKAGIQATLNARTSVLAAANPIHGRYDRSKTLKANLSVGPAIMSRFDLFFVVLDECDEANDRAIAEHIVDVHCKRLMAITATATDGEDTTAMQDNDDDNDGAEFDKDGKIRRFSTVQMQRYLRWARTINPQFPPQVQPKLVEYYKRLRQGDSSGHGKQAYRITVRQLEALIRLSEALARMHLSPLVTEHHVKNAFELLKTSIVQVRSEHIMLDDENDGDSRKRTTDTFEDVENRAFKQAEAGGMDDDAMAEELLGTVVVVPTTTVKETAIPISQAEFQRLGDQIGVYVRREELRQSSAGREEQERGTRVTDIIEFLADESQDVSDDNFDEFRRKVRGVIAKVCKDGTILTRVEPGPDDVFDDVIPMEERYFVVVRANWPGPGV